MGPWPPNLDWITDRLAVGGGVDSGLAERLAGELGISAIVDLRAEARHDPALLERHGMKLLHLPTEDHCAVDQAALDRGVAFVAGELAAGRRVLVHCREGVGRSALLALCVLVDQGAAGQSSGRSVLVASRISRMASRSAGASFGSSLPSARPCRMSRSRP